MKNLRSRFSKQLIHLVTRVLILLVPFGFFGRAAYSQITSTIPASRCGEGPLILRAAAATGTIKWYDVPFYGTAVGTGTSFTTPALVVTKTYYVDAVDGSDCSLNTGNARVQVIATINANSIQSVIFYSSNTFCKSIIGTQDVTCSGTFGGAFTVTPATGLTLNSSSGAISPSTSSVGTYTITYIAPASEGCSENPASATITISDVPVTPAISYNSSPYCTSAEPVSVIQTGASGGIYSATPAGLNINPSTGLITPSGSLEGNYIITYFVPGSGGCSPVSATTSLTINSYSIGGAATPMLPAISSGQSTTISLTGSYGNIQWQNSSDGLNGWANVVDGNGATTTVYSTPPLTNTTYYRALVTNGVCGSDNSTTVAINVSAVSVPGIATSSVAAICKDFTTSLTLSGYTGNIQWQTNSSGSFVDINGATSDIYTTPALTNTTSYKAVVTNGISAPEVSNEVEITVIPTAAGGSVNGTTICENTTADLNLSEYIGMIQWQSNASGSFVDIPGATNDNYTTPVLSTTTKYRAVVTNAPCVPVYSNEATVKVDPLSVSGTSTATETTLCSGGATTIALTDYIGSIQWQAGSSGAFADIKGETSSTYNTSALTSTTTYRAVVSNGVCPSAISTEATITILDDPELTQPGSVSICVGGNTILTTEADGGTGTYSYQWQYSADGSTAWTNVTSETPSGISYSGGNSHELTLTGDGSEIVQTGYYKCILSTATPTGAGCDATTSPVSVTTVPEPSWTSYNMPFPTSLCLGGSIDFSVDVTGGAGGTISWIRSDNPTPGSGTEVTVTTNDAPDHGTWYYRPHYAATGEGCTLADGTQTMVTVNSVSVGGTVSADQTICTGTTPADLVLTGITGDVEKWQKSSDLSFTSPTDIIWTGTTLTGFSTGNISSNTYFRAIVRNGDCALAYSTSILISVNSCLPVVNNSSASNVTSNSVTLNGDITSIGGSSVTAKGFKYSTSSNFDPVTSGLSAEGDGDMTLGAYTSNISGLSAATTYYVYAYVTNSYGTTYSSVIYFTTAAQLEFSYTGDAQVFIVPAGITKVNIETWGAQGGSTNYSGGKGGYSAGMVSVSAGDILYIYVGGQGAVLPVGDQGSWTAGGWNGGGSGYRSGRGGGGGSDVRMNGLSLSDRVIVAAGGGGASNTNNCYGGAGGGMTGSYGYRFGASDPDFCGQGGGVNIGGAACINYGFATAGIWCTGGNGGTSGNEDGTGGGGGYYGGGGGDQGGGGGGSSYTGGVTGGSTIADQRSGNGFVRITY